MTNNEVMDKLSEYYNRFNDSFPTMEVQCENDIDLVNKINHCLVENKTAYEMGYAKHPSEDVYY